MDKSNVKSIIVLILSIVIAAVGGFIAGDKLMIDEVTAIHSNVEQAVEGTTTISAYVVQPDVVSIIEANVANATPISISNIKTTLPNYMASNVFGGLITIIKVE